MVQLQAATGMGIQLSSSVLCFVTRKYSNRVEEENWGTLLHSVPAHVLEGTLENPQFWASQTGRH